MNKHDKSGFKIPINKGYCVHAVHTGGENGFLPIVLLRLIKSCLNLAPNKVTTSTQHNMNYENYEKYLPEILIQT